MVIGYLETWDWKPQSIFAGGGSKKNVDVIYEQLLNVMSVEVLGTLGKLSTNQVSKVEVQSLH